MYLRLTGKTVEEAFGAVVAPSADA
jgi:hypothetical protein